MVASGPYLNAQAQVLINQIDLLTQARSESLLRAYELSGLPFDDTALNEITDEVMQFAHQGQHNAVGMIGNVTHQALGGQAAPPNLDKALTDQIVRGVDRIMVGLRRDLGIRRDETILKEKKAVGAYAAGLGKKWDVFICHASEDKEDFVRGLANSLAETGLSVWYDETSIKVGDSLRRKIDDGLANSRFGVVVLSKHFFEKNWPQRELDGLISKEIAGTKVVLPVWHKVTLEEVKAKSPMLSGLVSADSSKGLDVVVRQLREAMGL